MRVAGAPALRLLGGTMKMLLLVLCLTLVLAAALSAAPVRIGIEKDNTLTFDGERFLPLGVAPGPPADFRTPDGKDGWKELADGGIIYFRCGPHESGWDKETEERVAKEVAAAAKAGGIGAWLFLRELCSVDAKHPEREATLRRIVKQYRNNPGVIFWKTADEPAWGEVPPEQLIKAYKIIHELDPNRPVLTIHAPRNTIEELRRYNDTGDVSGADIYPISVPPGKHSLVEIIPNRNISMVGDYTRRMTEVVNNKQPVFMVLQVTWSGAMPERGNVLVRPTFEQQRYMAYQALICGARGLHWFGFPFTLSDKDKPYGWNWTYWYDVLKPLLAEFKKGTELNRVLVAPVENLKLRVEGADDLEYLARDFDGKTYVLAAKREKPETEVKICGLGVTGKADVMFENRTVPVKEGVLCDSFKPNAVHVYRVHK